jgi:hypothetical protein
MTEQGRPNGSPVPGLVPGATGTKIPPSLHMTYGTAAHTSASTDVSGADVLATPACGLRGGLQAANAKLGRPS